MTSKTTQELYDVLGRKLPDECWLLIFMPEDVKEMRPDLSLEQCQQVLETFSACPGMAWDQVLGEHAASMFPRNELDVARYEEAMAEIYLNDLLKERKREAADLSQCEPPQQGETQ